MMRINELIEKSVWRRPSKKDELEEKEEDDKKKVLMSKSFLFWDNMKSFVFFFCLLRHPFFSLLLFTKTEKHSRFTFFLSWWAAYFGSKKRFIFTFFHLPHSNSFVCLFIFILLQERLFLFVKIRLDDETDETDETDDDDDKFYQIEWE